MGGASTGAPPFTFLFIHGQSNPHPHSFRIPFHIPLPDLPVLAAGGARDAPPLARGAAVGAFGPAWRGSFHSHVPIMETCILGTFNASKKIYEQVIHLFIEDS